MIVTWVTKDPVNESVVEYGIGKVNQIAYGTQKLFRDGGSQKRNMTIHRVILTNLLPGETYSNLTLITKIFLKIFLYLISLFSRVPLWIA